VARDHALKMNPTLGLNTLGNLRVGKRLKLQMPAADRGPKAFVAERDNFATATMVSNAFLTAFSRNTAAFEPFAKRRQSTATRGHFNGILPEVGHAVMTRASRCRRPRFIDAYQYAWSGAR